MKKIIAILFLTGILMSCTTSTSTTDENTKAKSETLFDEVMAAHDEVMPKMGDLRKLEKSFEASLDSITDQAEVEVIQANIKIIQDANANMMAWMRAFKPEALQAMEEDAKIKYLEAEKVKIEKVKSDMLQALELGN